MNRKGMLTLVVLLLFVFLVFTVGAQDQIADQEVEEFVILEQEVTPDGIRTIAQVPNFRDTFISSNRPNDNFGLSSNMQLGYSLTGQSLGAVRLLLQYNVQDYVPQGAVINSARLRIYLTGVTPAGDASMGFEGIYLTSDWSEKTVTWNSHQPDWGSRIGIGSASSSLGWHEADITKMVREWIDGGRKNHGFIIIGDEGIKDRLRVYATKDAQNGLASYVIVDYVQSVDTTPPVANMKSLPQWSPSNFVISWEGYDPNNPDGSPGSGVRWYDIWESTNNGSNWNILRAQVTNTESNFEGGEHLQTYSFTAQATDNAGNKQNRGGVQASTTVDAVPPVVSMNALPPVTTSPSFTVRWGGTDSGSGIASYDVQWRIQGQNWQWLYENTTLTSFTGQGAQDGVTYEFRARGTDKVGNHQAWSGAQASTTIALKPYSFITGTNPQSILQIKDGPSPGDSFQVFWEGYTAPGTTPLTYDVRVREPNQNWQSWLSSTSQTSGTYTLDVNDPDGTYYFEVRARNNLGQQEDFTGTPEGHIVVDRNAPFIEPAVWYPIITNEHLWKLD
jgi:hypothetical protein